MSERCRRLWQVEAARDGRLTGRDLPAFNEHTRTCRDCREERRAVDDLMRRLTEGAPAADEVFLRRERARLLEAAAAARPEPSRWSTPARWAVASVAAAMLAFAVWFTVRTRATPERDGPYASITPQVGARWERHRSPGVDEIELIDGTLSFVVRRTAEDPQVRVRVPEGEIDDIGTTFRVVVQRGRTQEIAVEEGSIVFRRPGSAPALVAGGSVWTSERVENPAPESAAASEPEPAPSAEMPVAPLLAAGPRPRSAAVATRAPSSPSATPATQNAADEDAAFLRIVSLRKQHREADARAAAEMYLERFPAGFRRADVLRFAHDR